LLEGVTISFMNEELERIRKGLIVAPGTAGSFVYLANIICHFLLGSLLLRNLADSFSELYSCCHREVVMSAVIDSHSHSPHSCLGLECVLKDKAYAYNLTLKMMWSGKKERKKKVFRV
jgi:hypothetical protein